MGCVNGIDRDHFPTQGEWLHNRVKVCFFYDTSKTIGGRIVRDDRDEPFETIIALDDGRFVRGTECQYSLVRDSHE